MSDTMIEALTLEERIRHLELYATAGVDTWLEQLLKRSDAMEARIAELEANAQHAPGWQLVHELEAERDNAIAAYNEMKLAYNDVFARWLKTPRSRKAVAEG